MVFDHAIWVIHLSGYVREDGSVYAGMISIRSMTQYWLEIANIALVDSRNVLCSL